MKTVHLWLEDQVITVGIIEGNSQKTQKCTSYFYCLKYMPSLILLSLFCESEFVYYITTLRKHMETCFCRVASNHSWQKLVNLGTVLQSLLQKAFLLCCMFELSF